MDDFHEVLEARGNAASRIQRDLGDVRRRAQRRRQRHLLAGTLTSVVVVAIVALVATAIGGFSSDRDQSVRSSLAGPSLLPVGWQPKPVDRTLSSGVVLRATMAQPAVIFGPYGTERRWIQPTSCPSPITISMISPNGSHLDVQITDLSRTLGTKVGVTVSPGPTSSGANGTVDAAVVVLRPVDGSTYRLVDGGTTIDQAQATDGMVALFGPVEAGSISPSGVFPTNLSPGVRIQQLVGGKVVEDQAANTAPATADTTSCSPPTSPVGVSTATAPDAADDAAIGAVVASMTPTNAPPSAGLANVDDPDGHLQDLFSGEVPPQLTLVAHALESYLVTPTNAWVHYGLQLGHSGAQPDSLDEWAQLEKVAGQWKVTTESFCVLASRSGVQCPGQPAYTALPDPGSTTSASGGS
jgi:hypothetical protein